jgi:hypothetical protein
MPFNQEVGNEFQEWALRAFPGGPLPENFQNLSSELRRQSTLTRPGGPVLAVRPDAVGSAVTVVWERLLGFPRPRTVSAPDSVFVEVKAVKGNITLSHNYHQIAGLIDLAANSPAGRIGAPEQPAPAVVFITTGDTVISPITVEEASRLGVALWQTVAFELSRSTTVNPRFGLGPVVPLNPSIYRPSWPEPLPPGPTDVPFPLQRGRLSSPTLVVDDPDPPEVQ